MRVMTIATAVAALAVAFAAPAIAEKGGNGRGNGSGGGDGANATSTGTIVRNESSSALGSTVTFSTSYSSNVKNPRVQVMCYQNGALVYGEAGSVDHTFTLGGYASQWVTNGGPASCKADLFDLVWNGNNPQQVTWLATTSFDAAG